MLDQNLFKKKQLLPYITAGFPTLKDTVELIKFFIDYGIEILEVGVPFSDPTADGPTIQYASNVALSNKTNLDKIFELVDKNNFSKKINIVLMTYLSPVIVYGKEKFFGQMAFLKIRGIICPDLIPEEKNIFNTFNNISLKDKYKIDIIYLISPTTTFKRRKLIYNNSSGFVYMVTTTGTTGAKKSFSKEFYNFVKIVRRETEKPICAGFGISNFEQVKPIIEYVDGIIIGSAIIDLIKNYSGSERYKKIKNFFSQFKF